MIYLDSQILRFFHIMDFEVFLCVSSSFLLKQLIIIQMRVCDAQIYPSF